MPRRGNIRNTVIQMRRHRDENDEREEKSGAENKIDKENDGNLPDHDPHGESHGPNAEE